MKAELSAGSGVQIILELWRHQIVAGLVVLPMRTSSGALTGCFPASARWHNRTGCVHLVQRRRYGLRQNPVSPIRNPLEILIFQRMVFIAEREADAPCLRAGGRSKTLLEVEMRCRASSRWRRRVPTNSSGPTQRLEGALRASEARMSDARERAATARRDPPRPWWGHQAALPMTGFSPGG